MKIHYRIGSMSLRVTDGEEELVNYQVEDCEQDVEIATDAIERMFSDMLKTVECLVSGRTPPEPTVDFLTLLRPSGSPAEDVDCETCDDRHDCPEYADSDDD